MNGLRLNLGCGMHHLDGYINVDRFGEPDLRLDLEVVPWPWPDDSVGEVVLQHVLEHLGRDPNVYLAIMKELYRVCHDGARIRIAVPHHRHEFFFNDPTHVRAVTADGMTLFSQRLNRQWVAQGLANSPLGLYLGIDFELVEVNMNPSAIWRRIHSQNPAQAEALLQMNALYNNLIEEVQMILRAVKPPGREVGVSG
ncbi:MAG: class I SAM-dependent methyltransferase [Isosphaeraceae bacterium]